MNDDAEIGREWRMALMGVPYGWTMTLAVTKRGNGNIYIAQAGPDEDETRVVQGRPTWAAIYALGSLREVLGPQLGSQTGLQPETEAP